MNSTVRSLLAAAGFAIASGAAAQVTFFEDEGLRGHSFRADRQVGDFDRFGFDNRAASAMVESGAWEVCERPGFAGRCVVLRPGRYDSLSRANLNFQISSVRPVEFRADAGPAPGYASRDAEYRRRDGERIFQADIVDVRGVMGRPGQQCWVEQQQIVQENRGNPNVPGAIAGAIIGGVLGHQIGSGRGNDVATAAGAVGGAALGSNIARGGDRGNAVSTQEVQRCATVSDDRPEYYEVTYRWNGTEHRVQMAAPPAGRTISVNEYGEPRV
jgi:uncharacterized protein YcfJ